MNFEGFGPGIPTRKPRAGWLSICFRRRKAATDLHTVHFHYASGLQDTKQGGELCVREIVFKEGCQNAGQRLHSPWP